MNLDVYNRLDVKFKSYSILNGDSLETHTLSSQGPAVFFFDYDINEIGDSVVIRFRNTKCLYYLKENSDKIFNIKKYDNYDSKLLNQSDFTLYYSISKQDYNQSEDCD